MIRGAGQTHGVIIQSPPGLSLNTTFTLPAVSGTLLVDDGSGKSSAWLLGGNDLSTASATEKQIGSLTTDDVELITGGLTIVRLMLDSTVNTLLTGQGTSLRFVEQGYTSFVAQARTGDVQSTLPATIGTLHQVLRIAAAPAPTANAATLVWATVAGDGGGSALQKVQLLSQTTTSGNLHTSYPPEQVHIASAL